MNLADILVIMALALVIALAFRSLRRNAGKGCSRKGKTERTGEGSGVTLCRIPPAYRKATA